MDLPLCVRVEDQTSIDSLKLDGWREIETLEIWAGEVTHLETKEIRRAEQKDLIFCQSLAARSFKHDRLHQDENVPEGIADQSKVKFVMMAFNVSRWDVLVWPGKAFVIFDGQVICLIAVEEQYRRQNVAERLVRSRAGWIEAGTQNINYPAKALYQSLGMEKINELKTFHKWQ